MMVVDRDDGHEGISRIAMESKERVMEIGRSDMRVC